MRQKIAFLGIKGLPAQAGVDRVVEAIVQRIVKDEYQPTVYCSSRVVQKGTHYPGVHIQRIPVLPGKHLHAASLFMLSALHALCFGNYDLIHVHNVEACFVLPLLRLRYRVIATSHGAAQRLDKWGRLAKTLISLTEYPYIRYASCATSVSQPMAAYYQRKYGKFIHYLPNGVAESQVDEAAAQTILEASGTEANQYILFAAGRIIPSKGCHLLLEAFRSLEDDLKLLIVGDTAQVHGYRQQLEKLADSRVRFIPFIADKDILFGLIRAARLFVFPSMVEAMSMMLLEAASLGTSMICSSIPENTAVLPDCVLLFESGNASDLRIKLRWALDHPVEMAAFAQTAQNWVRQTYAWDDIVRQYEFLYQMIQRPEPEPIHRLRQAGSK
jgi:glycosyltransferase involved in cell wall biosynthesis